MFHPLSTLFARTKLTWEETDIKFFVERYFAEKLKTHAVHCEKVTRGIITVRVGSPLLYQEVALLKFDLSADLVQQTQYQLRQLIVRVA